MKSKIAKKENWVKKHPVWSGIFGIILLGIVISAFSNGNIKNSNNTNNVEPTTNNVNNNIPEVAGVEATSTPYQEDTIELKIIDLSCEYGEYGWIYAKGRVKNEGNKEARYVKVNIDLFNGDAWVESDYTYIRNTDLPAGTTDSFEKTWNDDSIIFTRCEAFATYSEILS